ncbi:MAG: CbtA family protein [Microvirga sp.]
MFRQIILSAAAAGLAVGLAATALQAVTTTPLILKAEVYEQQGEAAHAAAGHQHAAEAAASSSVAAPAGGTPGTVAASVTHEHAAHEHAEEDHGKEAWAPADGLERTVYTGLSNILMAVAISSVLLGLMTLQGARIDARRGLLWGIAGFAAGSLLPSMGLPPELPGTEAAEILSRQAWWLTTMAASGAGLALLALNPRPVWKACGALLIVLPHIVGAPEPPTLVTAYPAGLASEFVSLSLAVSAFLWAVSGLAVGWLFTRFSAAETIEGSRSEQVV